MRRLNGLSKYPAVLEFVGRTQIKTSDRSNWARYLCAALVMGTVTVRQRPHYVRAYPTYTLRQALGLAKELNMGGR
jgi:hypothetical protein